MPKYGVEVLRRRAMALGDVWVRDTPFLKRHSGRASFACSSVTLLRWWAVGAVSPQKLEPKYSHQIKEKCAFIGSAEEVYELGSFTKSDESERSVRFTKLKIRFLRWVAFHFISAADAFHSLKSFIICAHLIFLLFFFSRSEYRGECLPILVILGK